MRVGFTGTRAGMTDKQLAAVATIIDNLDPEWFAHGDCVGADSEAHDLVLLGKSYIVIHPPANDGQRAYRGGATVVLMPKAYLARNRDIVDGCDVLVAAPRTMAETKRGGTWSTVRYARKIKRKIIVVWPNGTVTRENML